MQEKDVVMGTVPIPRGSIIDEREEIDEDAYESYPYSFQECLETVFVEQGIGVLRDAEEMMDQIELSEADRITKNVFRTILMTEVVDCFIDYAKEDVTESELVDHCTTLLKDEWGLSPSAFQPVIIQILAAVNQAVKVRRESVGKTICNQLKEMRRAFAKANRIEYEEEDCQETKPCSGTCPYCEAKTEYLIAEAKKLSATKEIIYPQMSVERNSVLGSPDKNRWDREIPACGGI